MVTTSYDRVAFLPPFWDRLALNSLCSLRCSWTLNLLPWPLRCCAYRGLPLVLDLFFTLNEWFSTFLMLGLLNKLLLLKWSSNINLFSYCLNCNVNTWWCRWSKTAPVKTLLDLWRGRDPQVENYCFQPFFMGCRCNSVVEHCWAFVGLLAQSSARRKASELCRDACLENGGIHNAWENAWHVIATLEIFAARRGGNIVQCDHRM